MYSLKCESPPKKWNEKLEKMKRKRLELWDGFTDLKTERQLAFIG